MLCFVLGIAPELAGSQSASAQICPTFSKPNYFALRDSGQNALLRIRSH